MMSDAYFLDESNLLPPGDLPFRLMFHCQRLEEFHYHNFGEFVCVLEGNGIHEIDGRSYNIHAGDIFAIPPW